MKSFPDLLVNGQSFQKLHTDFYRSSAVAGNMLNTYICTDHHVTVSALEANSFECESFCNGVKYLMNLLEKAINAYVIL